MPESTKDTELRRVVETWNDLQVLQTLGLKAVAGGVTSPLQRVGEWPRFCWSGFRIIHRVPCKSRMDKRYLFAGRLLNLIEEHPHVTRSCEPRRRGQLRLGPLCLKGQRLCGGLVSSLYKPSQVEHDSTRPADTFAGEVLAPGPAAEPCHRRPLTPLATIRRRVL